MIATDRRVDERHQRAKRGHRNEYGERHTNDGMIAVVGEGERLDHVK